MHDFHRRQHCKIYYVTIKTFPFLEALPWANWSWLLFLNILYATALSSYTAGEANSCKAPDSEWLPGTSGHQVSLSSLLQRTASWFCCCFDVGEGFGEEYCCFEELSNQILFVLHPFSLLGFFSILIRTLPFKIRERRAATEKGVNLF